jgi:hypothetical protein
LETLANVKDERTALSAGKASVPGMT